MPGCAILTGSDQGPSALGAETMKLPPDDTFGWST